MQRRAKLTGNCLSIAATGSSIEKGESLIDTVRTLQALGADTVVMRHPHAGAPYLVAQEVGSRMSVINAGASSMYPEIRSQIPKSLGGFAPDPPPAPAGRK